MSSDAAPIRCSPLRFTPSGSHMMEDQSGREGSDRRSVKRRPASESLLTMVFTRRETLVSGSTQ